MARFKKVKNEKEPVLPSQAWSTPVKQKSGSGDEDAAQSYLSGRVERVSSTGDALFDGINAGWGATVGAVGGALSAATGPVLSIGGEEEEKAGGGATETVRSDVTGGNNGGHKDTAEDETDNIDELDDLVAIKGAKLKSWEKSTRTWWYHWQPTSNVDFSSFVTTEYQPERLAADPETIPSILRKKYC